MAQPTAYEQYFLELVNRARANPGAEAARLGIDLNQGLSSGTIANTAKQPLAMNQFLNDSAQAHSDWMLATDTFSHTGAGGSSPGDRMKAAGYSFTGSWTWGENISISWGGGVGESAALVEGFHDGLFGSAGHRTNILNDGFKEVGIGVGLGEYKGSTGADATQNFARSGGATFLTGVAFDDKDGDRFYDPGEGLGEVERRGHIQRPARPSHDHLGRGRLAARAAGRRPTPSPSRAADWPRRSPRPRRSARPTSRWISMPTRRDDTNAASRRGHDARAPAATTASSAAPATTAFRGPRARTSSPARAATTDCSAPPAMTAWPAARATTCSGRGRRRLAQRRQREPTGCSAMPVRTSSASFRRPSGRDLIGDFRRAEGDRIDLSAIDADPRTAGDQAFLFADGMNFVAYQPGTVRTFRGASTTTVEADTGQGVLSFQVQGVVTFRADDFIL